MWCPVTTPQNKLISKNLKSLNLRSQSKLQCQRLIMWCQMTPTTSIPDNNSKLRLVQMKFRSLLRYNKLTNRESYNTVRSRETAPSWLRGKNSHLHQASQSNRTCKLAHLKWWARMWFNRINKMGGLIIIIRVMWMRRKWQNRLITQLKITMMMLRGAKLAREWVKGRKRWEMITRNLVIIKIILRSQVQSHALIKKKFKEKSTKWEKKKRKMIGLMNKQIFKMKDSRRNQNHLK